jgi:uncharacterized protein (TIGR00661 family)
LSGGAKHKKILVAPLNWGLGHAARCIPLIRSLLNHNFEPVLAGDGPPLELLKKEFPQLKYYELPPYSVQYAKKGSVLKYKLLLQTPKILSAVSKERKLVEQIIEKEDLKGIISDNRFGVRSDKIPSIYLTHQLKVLSGSTSFLSTKLHQNFISKFDECWIPDFEKKDSLAGELSQTDKVPTKIRYIGPLSRFSTKTTKKDIDLFVVLSGPEPQRSMLESQLTENLKMFKGQCLMVKGEVEETQRVVQEGNLKVVNFMLTGELEDTFHRSRLVICRSGYSSIMDLEALNAKAFFVPTPGQYEQQYLAKRMKKKGIANFVQQDKFSLEALNMIEEYSGFGQKKTSKSSFQASLFDVFK